jgi:anti-anti-sigma factor
MTNPEPGVLHTTMRNDGPNIWIDASGEIDLFTTNKMERAIGDALATSPARIYLDMSLISFIDSAGLSVLVSGHRLAEGQSCQLIIYSPSRQVERALALTGLDQYLRVET